MISTGVDDKIIPLTQEGYSAYDLLTGVTAMNLRELNDRFDTQEKCLAFIEKARWGKVVHCVECDGNKISRIKSSSKKQTVRWIYECLNPECRQQFTATSGTIMHDTHLPLQTWLMAISLVTQAKKGISAMQLQRNLGLGSYKTAWHLLHRIREAMASDSGLLGGTIEIDETFVGGRRRNLTRNENKTAVLGAVERGGDLKLATYGSPTMSGGQATKFANTVIGDKAELVVTDESPMYRTPLTKMGKRHESVNHSASEYVRYQNGEMISTNSIESAFSLLKRGIVGNFHQVSRKHLQRYLNEFEYRFNNRKNPHLFEQALMRVATKKPLPMRELTGETPR